MDNNGFQLSGHSPCTVVSSGNLMRFVLSEKRLCPRVSGAKKMAARKLELENCLARPQLEY